MKNILTMVKHFLEKIVSYFRQRKVNLNTLAYDFREKIYATIKQTEKKEGLICLGGDLKISLTTESKISVQFALYFQDTQKNYHEKSVKLPDSNLRILTNEAKKELYEEKEIVYDIEINNSSLEKEPYSSTS